jgi:type I restriction enzyme S subunit
MSPSNLRSTKTASASEGWRQLSVGEMVDLVQYGSSAKTSEDASGVPVLRMGNIQDGKLDLESLKYLPQDHAEFPELLLKDGDLLFNRTNSAELVGKSAVYRGNPAKCSCASYLIRVRLKPEFVPEYLCNYLNSPFGRQWIASVVSQQVGQANVNGSKLKALSVPVPGFDDQRSIVSEIEKQFTRLEAGVAALRRVQANLKRYRAAVLAAACEGRLVPTEAELARAEGRPFESGQQLLARILTERRQNWQGRGKYKEPATLSASGYEPESLPEGWGSGTVEQLNQSNRPCAYGVLQPGEDLKDGVPFVRVGDINDGKVSQVAMKRIAPAIAAQYPRTKLHGGELAITLVGAIGRTAVIPDSLAGGNTARAVGIIPLTKLVNPHWVEIWFRNPAKVAEMTGKSHEVARKTLNLEDVRAASVALPPLVEQTRIVAEVERRLSVVEELEAVVTTNLQRATRLRQAVLQKAFTGELTSVT